MRTTIDIDDALMAEAMIATGSGTKKGAIEVALQAMVRRHRQHLAVEAMAGLGWDGDLNKMRLGLSEAGDRADPC